MVFIHLTGGCDRNPCFANVACNNIGMRGSSFQCGDCPNGYTGDGITCTDVDEVNYYICLIVDFPKKNEVNISIE